MNSKPLITLFIQLSVCSRLSHLSNFRVPQRRPVDFVDDVPGRGELVDVSLATRRQLQDEDTPAEIPETEEGDVGLDRSVHEQKVECKTVLLLALQTRTSKPSLSPDTALIHTCHTPRNKHKQTSDQR